MQLLLQIKMEDAEEIESYYEKEVEKADKEFLKIINEAQNKNAKEIEKNYLEKLNSIKEEYKKKYHKYLGQQKTISNKDKKPKKKKEKTKTFKVERANLKLTNKEKLILKWGLLSFKLRIKRKNLYRKVVPKKIRVSVFISKIKLKRFFKSLIAWVNESFFDLKNKSAEKLENIKKTSKETYKKITQAIKSILSKILKKLPRKKEEESKESKKSEDQKIAEKLLKNKK